MSLLRNPKTEQDGQDGQDGRGLKVDIDNVDIGLRRGELHEVLTSPNALRQDKKSISTFALGSGDPNLCNARLPRGMMGFAFVL